MDLLKKISVGALLNGVVSALFLIVLGFAITGLVGAFNAKRATDTALSATLVTRDVFEALQATRLERGTTRSALGADAAASADTSASIANKRAQSAEPYERLFAICETMDCSPRVSVTELTQAVEELKSVRKSVDTALKSDLAGRPSGLRDEWTKSVTTVVTMLETMSTDLGLQVRMTDPLIGEQIAIKDMGYVVRAAAGLERNMMVDAIQAGSITPELATKMALKLGEINAAWPVLNDMIMRPGEPKLVIDAVHNAQKVFFDGVLKQRADIEAALNRGEPSPVTSAAWVKTTNASFDALVAVPMAALSAAIDHAEVAAIRARDRLIMNGALLLLALAIGGFGIVMISRRVVGPVQNLTHVMGELAKGHWETEVPLTEQGDELGHMARAVSVFKDNGIANERMQSERAQAQAEREARQTRVDEMIRAFDARITGSLDEVSGAASDMQATANAMSTIAENTSSRATAVAAATEEASSNVATVAAASEELSSSIEEIARQVTQSSEVAAQAVSYAGSTEDQMKQLSVAVEKIGDVVNLINDIAGQTNLLALNATIEAARAGDAGKGFAVVASEVKALATQTAKATEEISAQIAEVQSVTNVSVTSIGQITQVISQVNEIATAISAAVQEQSAATQEIARNIEQAARGTTEVSENVGGVNSAANETGDAASQVLSASSRLAEQASELSGNITTFLADIRAA
tara:strand:+ start:87536 stop:89629 length:2094 start_codon:yes stop_codon:yes gene_type:complete